MSWPAWVLAWTATAIAVWTSWKLFHWRAKARHLEARWNLGMRRVQPAEREAVADMSREELEDTALELAKGSRELVDELHDQANRVEVLEDALEQHRRRCCTRADCCAIGRVEA